MVGLIIIVGLYTHRLLPLGKAARLAGLNRWEFDDILGRRGVPAHYTEEDLIHDAAYAMEPMTVPKSQT